MDSASLFKLPVEADENFLPFEFLEDIHCAPFGLDEYALAPYQKYSYFYLPFEEEPVDFLIPFDDIVKVALLFYDSRGRRQGALSGAFCYQGTSADDFYLHLSDAWGQKFSYLKFLVKGSDNKLLPPTVCALWRDKNQNCACLVLQNQGLAKNSDPCACAVFWPCDICADGHSEACQGASSSTTDHGDASTEEGGEAETP